jgi:hypothetical protein
MVVVITLLAILGTIGFIAIGSYSASARDGVRITDLSNYLKALALLQIRTTTLPMPENAVGIYAGTGMLISYQGYLGADISRTISMNALALDPKDKTRYTYVTDAPMKKVQLMGYLESGENVKVLSFLGPVDDVHAAGYQDRHIYVTGDAIGVLTSGAGTAPVQENSSSTGVNLNSINTDGYVAYFGGDAF